MSCTSTACPSASSRSGRRRSAVHVCDGGWPWAGDARIFDCATVSRLVLLEAARGRGALSALLCACDAFHALGLPCRVTTRKRAVAERALGASPVLAADEGARAQRRAAAATNLDAAQRASSPSTSIRSKRRRRRRRASAAATAPGPSGTAARPSSGRPAGATRMSAGTSALLCCDGFVPCVCVSWSQGAASSFFSPARRLLVSYWPLAQNFSADRAVPDASGD